MKKILKNKDGITLISLVVTIIILLILAGISIGMLSGDNGILGQAGNAKTQTDIAGEKEIIDLAVVHAIGKSKYGDIDETSFTNELQNNNATVTKSGSKYKVTFTSGRQYEVDQDGNVKEKKVNPNVLEISELNEKASTYFGWDVINYAETLPSELQDTEWQLFYAGKLDDTDENEEERIYLISKEYVKNTVLPAKDGVIPIAKSGSDYIADFSKRSGKNATGGVIPQYAGSSDVRLTMQKYNKDYFEKFTSTKLNMKAVAYMLDTDTWSTFSSSSRGYAEYAIGGPSVELLFIAYNKYKGLTGNSIYVSNAKDTTGYEISKNGGISYENSYDDMIEDDVKSGISKKDNPFSVSSLGTAAYWLSSPSANNDYCVMTVSYTRSVGPQLFYGGGAAFRPLIVLNLNYTLEKTKDSNGNDAFKIVEQ